jgi:hypothetical protein
MPFRARPIRTSDTAALGGSAFAAARDAARPAKQTGLPPLAQVLEKKENREMNEIEPS